MIFSKSSRSLAIQLTLIILMQTKMRYCWYCLIFFVPLICFATISLPSLAPVFWQKKTPETTFFLGQNCQQYSTHSSWYCRHTSRYPVPDFLSTYLERCWMDKGRDTMHSPWVFLHSTASFSIVDNMWIELWPILHNCCTTTL